MAKRFSNINTDNFDKLSNESFRISVALSLGIKIVLSFNCICSTLVEGTATHSLDCRKRTGKHARHAELNDVVHRTLQAAGVPSQLEPPGLSRDDGKRPDGASIVPWKQGKSLVWDVTCVNTVAPSHVKATASQPGAACEAAEIKKRKKYSSLTKDFLFKPIRDPRPFRT